MEKSKSHLEKVVLNQESDNNIEEERRIIAEKILELVEKINESNEKLPFPGVHLEAYSEMKKTDDEYSGYTTPTDEIIERCEKEGIKVILSKDASNVFVLPAGSDDIEMDSIAPHQLAIDTVKNEDLAELIRLTKKRK